MDAKTLRQTYLSFFVEKGHAIIGSASLLPEHDPSVLFTTAGMHPLVPFLLGEPHPAGTRLVNFQKCLRTGDIDEVGDATHLTFFEMLGNWSLGDYWKMDAIQWSYEFLTERLGVEADRLHVTCFAGDDDAPRDLEAAGLWQSLGIPEQRITFLPKTDNWWGPAGATGPCGPDSEMFYDRTPGGPADENPQTAPERFVEMWNDVFMQYEKLADGRYVPLEQQNVDTGLGVERVAAVLQNAPTVFETGVFAPIMEHIRSIAPARDVFAERVIADHTRAAVFILAEGIGPGNVDQPYVARRLIRRAMRYGHEIGIEGPFLPQLAQVVIPTLSDVYPELERKREHILTALDEEEGQFRRTLRRGEKQVLRAIRQAQAGGQDRLPGKVVFRLHDTYGFPPELTEETAARHGLGADMDGYRAAFAEHQDKSRAGADARFRGGLADSTAETTRLHTATHLLQEALRRVLGPHVEQRGSNITPERLRFDFAHPDKLTEGQLAQVERLVNEQIGADLPVEWREMSVGDAEAAGAIGIFAERYGDRVKVYSVGDYSREICGGPHVERTGELGHFRIVKERSIGAGLRRIRAVLEV